MEAILKQQPFGMRLILASDQGEAKTPPDPAVSLRGRFREVMLPGVFRAAVSALKPVDGGD